MESVDTASNHSIAYTPAVVSIRQRHIVGLVIYVILCCVISVFGSVANVINMVVFYRQGLDTTINISFFSLAVSDLFSLILQQLFNIYINPQFLALNLPIVHIEFQYLTTAVAREMFARITCLITAFITAERCLCVVFPLTVNTIITPRVTTVFMVSVYSLTLLSPLPIFFTTYITWKFFKDSNTTLLGLVFTKHNDITENVVYVTHAFATMAGFLSVLTFTLILIYKLKQKNVWRQTANVGQEKAKSMSRRDRATITMVVLVAVILVVCYTPAVLLVLVRIVEPEFSVAGRLINLCYCLWAYAILCENINSSVNIFLYYNMSSKYRQTLRELVYGRPHVDKKFWTSKY